MLDVWLKYSICYGRVTIKNGDAEMSNLSQNEFKKLWSREAVNQPGLMIETVSLIKDPIILRRPIMRKSA